MYEYRFSLQPDAINLTKTVYHNFSTGVKNQVLVMRSLQILHDQNRYVVFFDDNTGFSMPSLIATVDHPGGQDKVASLWANPCVIGSNSLPAVGQYVAYTMPDIEFHDLIEHQIKADDWSIVVTRTGGIQSETQHFILVYDLLEITDEDWLKLKYTYSPEYEVIQ